MRFRVAKIYEHVQGSRINLSKNGSFSKNFFGVYELCSKTVDLLGFGGPAGALGGCPVCMFWVLGGKMGVPQISGAPATNKSVLSTEVRKTTNDD